MENTDPKWTSICPGCFRKVSNRSYFAGPQGSAHFRGTCEQPTFYPKTIPERTVDKPAPYPMPPMPDYDFCRKHTPNNETWECSADCKDRVFPYITTYADLAKWWGLDKPKKEKPNRVAKKETAAQWIKAHPEIAYANKQSRAAKTLARMGLTA